MAVGGAKITLDQAKLGELLKNVTGASSKRAAEKTAARANANVRAKGRVRTGALAQSYRATPKSTAKPDQAEYEVSSPLSYAGFQEDGIGPVHARPGGVLRFQPKGSSVFIFRPRTSGFTGAHQLRDAFRALTPADFLP